MSLDLTVAEHRGLPVSFVARVLRLPVRTVRYYVATERLTATRQPHHWCIRRSDLDRFVECACASHGVEMHLLSMFALMTVNEVAVALGRSTRTIRLSAQLRRLPAFKIGRSWRVWRSDVEAQKSLFVLKRVS